MHRAVISFRVHSFSGKEDGVVYRFIQNLSCLQSAYLRITVSAAAKWIVTPVVVESLVDTLVQPANGCAKNSTQRLNSSINKPLAREIDQFLSCRSTRPAGQDIRG
jgi:hypothetical protein